MRRILIVDDEKFIRAGLRSMIERFRPSKYLIVEAKNGEEALSIIESQHFDIIISDIKMPKMTGLELSKEVSKLHPETKIIILSGFNDFEFAVESMKYGVKGYLLKPVERDKLFELLSTIEKEIEEADEKKKRMNTYNKNQLKYILLKESIDYEEIKNVVDGVKIKIFDKPYFISSLNGDFHQLEKFKEEFDAFYHDGLEISFFDSMKNLVLICHKNISVHRFLNEIIDYDFKFNIGVSHVSEDKNEIKKLYQRSTDASVLSYILSKHEICSSNNLGVKDYNYKALERSLEKFAQKLEYTHQTVIKETIDTLYDIEKTACYRIGYMRDLNEIMKRSLCHMLESKLPQKYSDLITRYGDITEYNHYTNLMLYKKALTNFLVDVVNHLNNLRDELSGGNDIDFAISYIEANYYKDINMAMVSNHVSLNYSYFSQLFKEQTGMNFVDFLKHLRIEKSKELLKDTDYKIYEIGAKVGFQNPKHFMKSFKLIVGISPSEYRKKII